MAPDFNFTSSLVGEVDATAAGDGFRDAFPLAPVASGKPLTPALSPQGRGGDGAATPSQTEALYGTA